MKQLIGLFIASILLSSTSFAKNKYLTDSQPYERLAECLGSIANPIYRDPAALDSRINKPTSFGSISDDPNSGFAFVKKDEAKVYFITKYEVKEQEVKDGTDPLRVIKRSSMKESSEDVFSAVILRKFSHLGEHLKQRYQSTYQDTGGLLSMRQLRNIKEGICTCMKSGIALREIASAKETISNQSEIKVRFEDGVRPVQQDDLECVTPAIANVMQVDNNGN